MEVNTLLDFDKYLPKYLPYGYFESHRNRRSLNNLDLLCIFYTTGHKEDSKGFQINISNEPITNPGYLFGFKREKLMWKIKEVTIYVEHGIHTNSPRFWQWEFWARHDSPGSIARWSYDNLNFSFCGSDLELEEIKNIITPMITKDKLHP
jgi:hypothetical protein